jgi:hypothetical protein
VASKKEWKQRAKSAEGHLAVVQDLNRNLTASYKEGRGADVAAVYFAAEAIAAIASDAAALRSIQSRKRHAEYVDYLTFRLRQNLVEARSFLDEHNQVNYAATLADLLNELPPDPASKSG